MAAAPIRKSERGQTSAVFHIDRITNVYSLGDVEVHALRGVELDLYPGEFIVVLGPSGSGKSTLLNILGGLDVPTCGEVRYRDHKNPSAIWDVKDARITRNGNNVVVKMTAVRTFSCSTKRAVLRAEMTNCTPRLS
jgi:predicted ABC-type transport system involved in lysophospholipase L1 biosynthesis ATPase subunit